MGDVQLILLSGAVASGKSSVAKLLQEEYRFSRVSTGSYLQTLAKQRGLAFDRVTMQDLGDTLDMETEFTWPVTVAMVQMVERPSDRWLLDAVRKRRQVHHFRARIAARILHIHLTAPERILRSRYEARLAAGEEYGDGSPYYEFVQSANEIESRSLIEIADLSIDTSVTSPDEAKLHIVDLLGI